jgi:Tfp pilus assembly protein PilV
MPPPPTLMIQLHSMDHNHMSTTTRWQSTPLWQQLWPMKDDMSKKLSRSHPKMKPLFYGRATRRIHRKTKRIHSKTRRQLHPETRRLHPEKWIHQSSTQYHPTQSSSSSNTTSGSTHNMVIRRTSGSHALSSGSSDAHLLISACFFRMTWTMMMMTTTTTTICIAKTRNSAKQAFILTKRTRAMKMTISRRKKMIVYHRWVRHRHSHPKPSLSPTRNTHV